MQRESMACTEARRRAHVEEQARSGLTVAAYCAGRGLSRWTLYEWRRRLRAERTRSFVPVTVVARPGATATPAVGSSAGVEVVLAGGRRLRLERGFDPATLSAAVETLEVRAC